MASVTLSTTHGDIVLDVNEAAAPNTAANFLQYVKEGHYDGTIFHRVMEGFMIQCGGFTPGMNQKGVRAPIQHEGETTSKAGLKNAKYTIAMARTNDPHSATAQFFINVADNDFLDFKAPNGSSWGYAVFGKVTQGMDVVDKIKNVRTGNSGFHQNVPVDDVVINKATVA